MTHPNYGLEPIAPRDAIELFLQHEEPEVAKATLRNHRNSLKFFRQWCEENDTHNLNELTGRDLQQFRLWRRQEFDLNQVSLKNNLCAIRVFLRWAGTIEAVPPNLWDKIQVPRIDRADQSNDEMLDADDAHEILQYLSTYQYSSVEHVLLALMWHTGLRVGAIHSLDVGDVNLEEQYVNVLHRPDTGTTLKNGSRGERPVAIAPKLGEMIEEYLAHRRRDHIEESGREPLITSARDRMSVSTMRSKVYQITAPCYRGLDCPDCDQNWSKKCGEAVGPHAIRRGSITYFLQQDVPVYIIEDRMNVSKDVLEAHYDERSKWNKLEQRREYLGDTY